MRYELYTKTATVKKKSNIQCNLTYNTGALLFGFSLINAVKEAKVYLILIVPNQNTTTKYVFNLECVKLLFSTPKGLFDHQ